MISNLNSKYEVCKMTEKNSQDFFPFKEIFSGQSLRFPLVADAIREARRHGRPVLWMIGAHVVKNGLSPLLIDLLQRGIVTHLATNGAGTIHDFEIALIGETSEDVAESIETGSFGMAEETGALMNRAIQAGVRDGLGFGEALGRFIAEEAFPHREDSLLYHAHRLHVPLTAHIGIGTDIIHQHPTVDFGALGWASGQDFRIYCHTVSRLVGAPPGYVGYEEAGQLPRPCAAGLTRSWSSTRSKRRTPKRTICFYRSWKRASFRTPAATRWISATQWW